MSEITQQEIYYKFRMTFNSIDSIEDTFSGLFYNLTVLEKTDNSAVLEITTHNSINPYYTKRKIKRIIWDKLYSKAIYNIDGIEDIDFKEEAEIYSLT